MALRLRWCLIERQHWVMIRGSSSGLSCVLRVHECDTHFQTGAEVLIWTWALRTGAVLGDKKCEDSECQVMGMQTCSRPPFRSSSSLGGPGSGPGLPLCRHHRASREVLQEKGPSRRRLRSFRPVFTRRSWRSSCTDAAWTTSRENKQ